MATTEQTWSVVYPERRHTLGGAVAWLMGLVFGCRHRRMGLPVTREGRTYRVCLCCGMTRDFDLATWETYGPYRQRG
jgi:hypothetical protein